MESIKTQVQLAQEYLTFAKVDCSVTDATEAESGSWEEEEKVEKFEVLSLDHERVYIAALTKSIHHPVLNTQMEYVVYVWTSSGGDRESPPDVDLVVLETFFRLDAALTRATNELLAQRFYAYTEQLVELEEGAWPG